MKAITLSLLLVALPAAASGPAGEVAGFKAEYEASYAIFSGSIVVELREGEKAGEYVYEVFTRARGLAKAFRSGTARETSTFRLQGDSVIPLVYDLDDGTPEPENDMHVEFDWEAGVAHSSYQEVPEEVPIEPGMLDRQTADVQSIIELRAGRQPGSYDIVYKNSVRTYGFEFLSEETIKVPAGTFETVKYNRQRPGSTRNTLIWFAKDYDYLPVRIEQQKRGKTAVTMVAKSVQSDAR